MSDKNVKYTEDQLIAIDSNNTPASIVAGAGSGKTTVLIERTKHLLNNTKDLKLEDILLITFTENAVLEIKKKLISDFSEKSSVYTFHGFANQILHEHPALLKVDPSFSIMDEVKSKTLYEETLTRYLTRPPTPEIQELSSEILKHFTPSALTNLLLNLYEKRHVFYTKKDLNQISNELCKLSPEVFLTFKLKTVKNTSSFKKYLTLLKSIKPINSKDKMWNIRNSILPLIEKFENNLFELKHFPPLNCGSTKNYEPGDFENLKKALSFFKKLTGKLDGESIDKEKNLLSLKLTSSIFELFKNFETHLNLKKDKLNLLDFSDLEILTQNVSKFKWISRYYNNKYKYVLIDEFQDTSIIQSSLIKALFPINKLVIVGDPKQSIYKFRNADVSIFDEISKEILNEHGREIALNKNFRSHPNLLFFFNTIFDLMLSYRHFKSNNIDEELLGSLSHIKENSVNPQALWEGRPEDKTQGKIEITHFSMPEEHSLTKFEFESEIVAQKVSEYILNGSTFGDITVLLHSKTHILDIEKAFQKYKIPFYSFDSVGFFENFEVYDLINIIKASFDPSDDISFVATLKSSLIGLTDQELIDIYDSFSEESFHKNFSLFVKKTQKHVDILKYLDLLREKIKDKPLSEFALELMYSEKLKNTILASENPYQRKANMEKLLSLITSHENEESFLTPIDWIKYFDKIKNPELFNIGNAKILDDNENSVKIMTIHKSKGLEFPCVIIPFCNNNPAPKGVDFLFNEDLPSIRTYKDEETYKNIFHFFNTQSDNINENYESIRLFYVALTRAKNNISIIGEKSKKPKPISLTAKWIDSISNILPLEDIDPGEHEHKANISYFQTGRKVNRKIVFNFTYSHINEAPNISVFSEKHDSETNTNQIPSPYEKTPLQKLPEISVMSLQHYTNCPYYYYLRYIVKISEDTIEQKSENFLPTNKTDSKLKANIRGQIIHKLFENFANKDFQYEIIENTLRDTCSYFGEELTNDDMSSLLEDAQKSFESKYFRELHESLEKHIEYPFLLKLKSKIKGTIDRIDIFDDKVVITDYKSVKNTENKENLKKYHIQASIYAIAASKLFPNLPIEFNFFFTGNQECLKIEFDKNLLLKKENEIIQIIEKIEAGEFERNKKSCEYCLLMQYCQ